MTKLFKNLKNNNIMENGSEDGLLCRSFICIIMFPIANCYDSALCTETFTMRYFYVIFNSIARLVTMDMNVIYYFDINRRTKNQFSETAIINVSSKFPLENLLFHDFVKISGCKKAFCVKIHFFFTFELI